MCLIHKLADMYIYAYAYFMFFSYAKVSILQYSFHLAFLSWQLFHIIYKNPPYSLLLLTGTSVCDTLRLFWVV